MMQNWTVATPEMLLLAVACLVLIVDVYWPDIEHRAAYWLSQAGVLSALGLLALYVPQERLLAFSNTFISDAMAVVLKAFVCTLTVLVFVYGRDYLMRRGRVSGEYFALGLFAVIGMMVLISAASMLTLYLGLELLSLSLYAMVAMEKESPAASEAAMKYFVLGAIASGMLLYGISMLYGATGALELAAVAEALAAEPGSNVIAVFGLLFVIIGISFKLGVVPFHMWLPDVYEGAATSTTLFIAAAPKLAAFALAIRLLADGTWQLVDDWRQILAVLAALSMLLGNVVAIAQQSIKRMLAYSTIAHMGFLLLGIAAGTVSGFAGAMFYAITYSLMSAGAFGVVIALGRQHFESDQLADFAGLSRRAPWVALLMLILMFSMAGVPPFAGFWAKWFVIKEAVAEGLVWLAVVGVLTSVIGAYYYLRIIRLMYFDEPASREPVHAGGDARFILSANGLAILALGLAPGMLMSVCLVALRH